MYPPNHMAHTKTTFDQDRFTGMDRQPRSQMDRQPQSDGQTQGYTSNLSFLKKLFSTRKPADGDSRRVFSPTVYR